MPKNLAKKMMKNEGNNSQFLIVMWMTFPGRKKRKQLKNEQKNVL